MTRLRAGHFEGFAAARWRLGKAAVADEHQEGNLVMKSFAPALLVMWLAGCAAPMGFEQPPDRAARACNLSQPNTADCEIAVDVQPSADPAKVCTVTVPASVVFEGITGANPKWIFWRLDLASGFVFRNHVGIEFKDPRARFSDGKVIENGAVYRVMNLGKANVSDPAQSWYYGIHLERANDGMRCGFDPLIKNQ
jgi:hypothetical protein